MIIIKHRILELLTPHGRNPFRMWLHSLPEEVVARVEARLYGVELGNLGDFKPAGSGVFELRLHFGPGYRIYFAREGSVVILLLGGGDKGSQRRDIARAKRLWKEYRGGRDVSKKR